MHFRVTVRKLNVTDGQTDGETDRQTDEQRGGGGGIAIYPGPSARGGGRYKYSHFFGGFHHSSCQKKVNLNVMF